MRYSLAIVVLCAGLARADDAELVKRLDAEWQHQRTAIKTARIRARAFRTGDVNPLSASDIKALFDSVDLANRPDDLRKVVAKIWQYEVSTPDPWTLVEVTVDGARLRERYFYRPGELHDNVVDQGITVIGNCAANQVSILRTADSKWVFRKLDDFRYIPPEMPADLLPGFELTVAERKRGRVRLKRAAGPADYDVDVETGFVHAYRCYLDDFTILAEVLQVGAGDVLPAAIARLSYKDGKLINAHILVVESAEINLDLPADAFTIKAPKGAIIVDARDPKAERARRTDAEIDDVVRAFPLDP